MAKKKVAAKKKVSQKRVPAKHGHDESVALLGAYPGIHTIVVDYRARGGYLMTVSLDSPRGLVVNRDGSTVSISNGGAGVTVRNAVTQQTGVDHVDNACCEICCSFTAALLSPAEIGFSDTPGILTLTAV